MIYSVCKCDTRPSVRYLAKEERVRKPLLGSKAKPLPPKLYVKFECQIWSEFAKQCLDASSLHSIAGNALLC